MTADRVGIVVDVQTTAVVVKPVTTVLNVASAGTLGAVAADAPITVSQTGRTATVGLAEGGVANEYLAAMAPLTIKGNVMGDTAGPLDLPPSDVLDSAFGSARGNILYRGADGWTSLASGTLNQLLASTGPLSDPQWVGPPGAGGAQFAVPTYAALAAITSPALSPSVFVQSFYGGASSFGNVGGGVFNYVAGAASARQGYSVPVPGGNYVRVVNWTLSTDQCGILKGLAPGQGVPMQNFLNLCRDLKCTGIISADKFTQGINCDKIALFINDFGAQFNPATGLPSPAGTCNGFVLIGEHRRNSILANCFLSIGQVYGRGGSADTIGAGIIGGFYVQNGCVCLWSGEGNWDIRDLRLVADGTVVPPFQADFNITVTASIAPLDSLTSTLTVTGIPSTATGTGTIDDGAGGPGHVLTIAGTTGTIAVGDYVSGTGVTVRSKILSQTSGTPGGDGVYDVGGPSVPAQLVSSASLILNPNIVQLGKFLLNSNGTLDTSNGVLSGTRIIGYGTGTGLDGTYIVNGVMTVASAQLTIGVYYGYAQIYYSCNHPHLFNVSTEATPYYSSAMDFNTNLYWDGGRVNGSAQGVFMGEMGLPNSGGGRNSTLQSVHFESNLGCCVILENVDSVTMNDLDLRLASAGSGVNAMVRIGNNAYAASTCANVSVNGARPNGRLVSGVPDGVGFDVQRVDGFTVAGADFTNLSVGVTAEGSGAGAVSVQKNCRFSNVTTPFLRNQNSTRQQPNSGSVQLLALSGSSLSWNVSRNDKASLLLAAAGRTMPFPTGIVPGEDPYTLYLSKTHLSDSITSYAQGTGQAWAWEGGTPPNFLSMTITQTAVMTIQSQLIGATVTLFASVKTYGT